MIDRKTSEPPTYLSRCGRVFRAYVRAVNLTNSAPQMSDIGPDLDIDSAVAYGAEIITRAIMELMVSRLTEGTEASTAEICSRMLFFCEQLNTVRPGLGNLSRSKFYEYHEGAPLYPPASESPDA